MRLFYLFAVVLGLVFNSLSLVADPNDDDIRNLPDERGCILAVAIHRMEKASDLPTRTLGLRMLWKLLQGEEVQFEPPVGNALFELACGNNPECRRLAKDILLTSRARNAKSNPAVERFVAALFQDPFVDASGNTGISEQERFDFIYAYLTHTFLQGNSLTAYEPLRNEISRVDLSDFSKKNPPPPLVQLRIWALRRLAILGEVRATKDLIEIARQYNDVALLWGIPDEAAINIAKFTYETIILPQLENPQISEAEFDLAFTESMFRKYSQFYLGALEPRAFPDLLRLIPLRTNEGKLIAPALDIYLDFIRRPKIPALSRASALNALCTLKSSEADYDNALTGKYLALMEELKTNPILGEEGERKAAVGRIAEALRFPSN